MVEEAEAELRDRRFGRPTSSDPGPHILNRSSFIPVKPSQQRVLHFHILPYISNLLFLLNMKCDKTLHNLLSLLGLPVGKVGAGFNGSFWHVRAR